jgi:hypothetical protein
MMALKATLEPMLMSERTHVMMQVKMMELRGTGVLLNPYCARLVYI